MLSFCVARLLHVPDPETTRLICSPNKDLWSFSGFLGSVILYLLCLGLWWDKS